MTDLTHQRDFSPRAIQAARHPAIIIISLVLLAFVIGITLHLASKIYNLDVEAPLLTDSTFGELAVWMSDQSGEDDIVSFLGQYADNWASQLGEDELDAAILLTTMRNGLVVWFGIIIVTTVVGTIGLTLNTRWSRSVLLSSLFGLDSLLFIIPTIEGDDSLRWVLVAITILLGVLLFAPGKVTKVLGFVVVLSALLVVWETGKIVAQSVNYSVQLPHSSWSYTTYPALDDTLTALEAGDIDAVIVDQRDVSDIILPYPAEEVTDADEPPAYPNLRILTTVERAEYVLGLPVSPEFPGRLAVVVREVDTTDSTFAGYFTGLQIGTVAEEYADTNYLSQPRNIVVLNLRILNDLNLPHLQNIAEALLQPARRNGPMLLIRILGGAGLYTWGEAILGFTFGATLGFLLGTLFAHSKLMQRGLLPYVVASQTIPILAFAPMVVIWLGAGPQAVAVIAAYLTFFPVTINTMRGLQSPDPMKIELMQSYAASKWTIMWKLRFPSALPYIFTALKVSATASVVGAIIGELPSSIRDGLGRAILDFSSDYSLISTPKLWGAIFVAAMIGILSFSIVVIAEYVSNRWGAAIMDSLSLRISAILNLRRAILRD